jgi:hypothetical protein
MSHSILLIQPGSNAETRTYSDYESVNDLLEGVCRIYEGKRGNDVLFVLQNLITTIFIYCRAFEEKKSPSRADHIRHFTAI